jgi:Zn ribbon nucleic-acid-binding protein
MALPFYDRTTAVCPGCKRRPHLDAFRKWRDGVFGMHALCSLCEPSVKPEHPDPTQLRHERIFLADRAERLSPARETKLVPMATCPGCNTLLKLQLFRKWWGTKRMKRTLCIQCEPERKLEDMTAAEREAMLDMGRSRVTPERLARLKEAAAQAQRQRRSTGAKRRHSAARTQAWSPTMRVLRDERAWCQKNQITPASPEWRMFFEAYTAALNAALQQAGIKKRNAASTTQVPKPYDFMYLETLQSLSRLYAACPVIRGRKMYRDPVFLKWLNEDMVSSLKGEK